MTEHANEFHNQQSRGKMAQLLCLLISLVLLASLISSYQCDFTDSRLGERRVSHAGSSTAGLYQGETWE